MTGVQISAQDGKLQLSGELTFKTVKKAWEQLLPFLRDATEYHINLLNINVSDSAGLALLLECSRFAKSKQKSLIFSHVPQQLKLLAAVSGVETILFSAR